MPSAIRWRILSVGFILVAGVFGRADEPPQVAPHSVEQIVRAASPAVVVITVAGRDGRRYGLGAGFIISPDGLIATNLHVIGEARPIKVQLADGRSFDVSSVHASDRRLDLAVVKIDAVELPALELGDSDQLAQGQAVVGLGNPQGLRHSVVSGVVSAVREVEGRPMIQLAIPLEPGNSGGPLLDTQGRVQGVLTMKSSVTANLGFAATINQLKPLLEQPNPTPIGRWLTVGALDASRWEATMGAEWRQRAGRILVEGAGEGFGGRSLCLWKVMPPDAPFEVAVEVRLEDESGAAGLVFASDGGERHYGFYPSAGNLRLTRFDGPDVLNWTILDQRPSPSYRAGEWNRLRVRFEPGKIACYVNDELLMESHDAELAQGRVGLAKFRDTKAAFRRFTLAQEVGRQQASPELAAKVSAIVDRLAQPQSLPADVASLGSAGAEAVAALRGRAELLERQADQLNALAAQVDAEQVRGELVRTLEGEEEPGDLVRAALLIARLDNDEVDVDGYVREFERLADSVATALPAGADEASRLAALDKFFFEESGFHGSRGEYYHRANSYLNEVLDDREGLPITLALLYIELGRSLKIDVEGVGLPGHFVVRYAPPAGEATLIDVFEGGERFTEGEAAARVRANTGGDVRPEHLAPTSNRDVIVRILHNLLGDAQRQNDVARGLRYLDAILDVSPNSYADRWSRAVLRWQTRDRNGAAADVDWLLERSPDGVEIERLREFRDFLDKYQE